MLKPLSILLGLLIFFQSYGLEVEELSKLNELYEHTRLHARQYGDSIFDFIEKHYGNLKDQHQDKHAGHDKLPYQKDDCKCIHMHFAYVLGESTPVYVLKEFSKKQFNFRYKEPSTNLIAQAVFQPPRQT